MKSISIAIYAILFAIVLGALERQDFGYIMLGLALFLLLYGIPPLLLSFLIKKISKKKLSISWCIAIIVLSILVSTSIAYLLLGNVFFTAMTYLLAVLGIGITSWLVFKFLHF